MTKVLTVTKKERALPLLIDRDGFQCLYCNKPFERGNYIFEHLNSNRKDNRLENLALSHHTCNIKKIDNIDYQIIAQEKLRKNESELFLGEKHFQEENISNEVVISRLCFTIVEEHITEVIKDNGFYPYKEALPNSMFLCRKKVGNGSEQAIRRHLMTLTAPIADFELIKKENVKCIVKREKRN